MVGSIQPGRPSSALCECMLTVPTNPLDHCFSSVRFKGYQRQLTDTVSVCHCTVATSV